MSHKNQYRERILSILKSHDGPMWIVDLRKNFMTDRGTTSAVTSAIHGLDENGEIRIIGGYDRGSKKMLEVIRKPDLPMADKVRVVRLTNERHWQDAPSRPYCGVSGSTLGYLSAAF